MNIGAEMPFRRKASYRRTGSLVLDHERETVVREQAGRADSMKIWDKGHFREA
ncbi:hypothetical protein MTR62_12555 [Novosphingobium sp. 1949]|uniref:Uncharacterized protein n=1 Tax=Novosphingobium organovorum TaxID=2930092 RepID=A0ABT0BEN7_9SPHN|nr:hypothetical protein [Novosphingobium organovorum]MCJ2183515.1 hypothetical protein [Novosphingobium organovorum]